jgi:hypothetical protein
VGNNVGEVAEVENLYLEIYRHTGLKMMEILFPHSSGFTNSWPVCLQSEDELIFPYMTDKIFEATLL